jgi:hypothetical protein
MFIMSCAVRNIELSLHFLIHAIWNDTLVYCQAVRTVRPTFELDLNKSEEAGDHKPGSGIGPIATTEIEPAIDDNTVRFLPCLYCTQAGMNCIFVGLLFDSQNAGRDSDDRKTY